MPDSGNHLSAAEKLRRVKKLYRQHKMSYKEFRLWEVRLTRAMDRAKEVVIK